VVVVIVRVGVIVVVVVIVVIIIALYLYLGGNIDCLIGTKKGRLEVRYLGTLLFVVCLFGWLVGLYLWSPNSDAHICMALETN